MSIRLTLTQSLLSVCALSFIAAPALGQETGAVLFAHGGTAHAGQFALADRALSVKIDGLQYQGHFQANHETAAPHNPTAARTGRWGRAFLFASSAKVLQCQLDTGFPRGTGWCQDAEGRDFQITTPARPLSQVTQ